MGFALRALALAGLLFCALGCAGNQQQSNGSGQVSTIPWNRPEKWEGTGMLGGFGGQH